jgi:hypothetical protein
MSTMTPTDALNRAYDEAQRLRLLDVDQRVREWMKDASGLVTAETGEEVHLTNACVRALETVAVALFEGDATVRARITRKAFESVARDVFANCCVDPDFGLDASKRLGTFRRRILEHLEDQTLCAYPHAFPAWTLGLERENAFSLGPATIETKEQWLARIKIAEGQKEHVIAALGDCTSVITVSVQGKDISLSRETAWYVARLTLDGLALWFGRPDLLRQLLLADERAVPVRTRTLTYLESVGWAVGGTANPRGWIFEPIDTADFTRKMRVQLAAVGGALQSLVEGIPTRHAPDLDRRWLTALFWYGEACREPHTFVAIGKLGVCLDVLSGGGEVMGILAMATNLTGKKPDDVVVPGRSMTLKRMVKAIYSEGRSQILHGGRLGLLEPLEPILSYASDLARVALQVAVVRLDSYRGLDEKEAFRTMPGA